MGFEPPRTVLKLIFEAPELEGLEVRMYVPPLGEVQRLTKLSGMMGAASAAGNLTAEQAEEGLSVYGALAEYLKSWNVTRNNEPVPATMDGLRTQEITFLNVIMQAWMSTVGDVDAPLGTSSSSTPPPDLSSLPMERLPESLAS